MGNPIAYHREIPILRHFDPLRFVLQFFLCTRPIAMKPRLITDNNAAPEEKAIGKKYHSHNEERPIVRLGIGNFSRIYEISIYRRRSGNGKRDRKEQIGIYIFSAIAEKK